jgi:hypothetical protein
MMRTCDGNDPNLVKYVPGDKEDVAVPCDCGLTFDDVYHMVIYPHVKFAGPPPQRSTRA